jgi:hypothetical protein
VAIDATHPAVASDRKSGRMDEALPFVSPLPHITEPDFMAFYIMAATIARCSETDCPNILASRLELLKESYHQNIVKRAIRLAPCRQHGPVVHPVDVPILAKDGLG